MATRGRMGDFSRAPTGIQAALPTGRQLAALARLVGWGVAWRLQEGQFDKLRSRSGVLGLLMALAYLRGNTQLAAHDGGSARPQPTHTAFTLRPPARLCWHTGQREWRPPRPPPARRLLAPRQRHSRRSCQVGDRPMESDGVYK